jgi:mono-ADP-ribosyltransferase sirtuin 6
MKRDPLGRELRADILHLHNIRISSIKETVNMASTALKVPLPERRDPPEVIDQQASQLVELIKKSKHFIVFTGAGVSTSAGELLCRVPHSNSLYSIQNTGIPDFRGPEGAWTLRAQGRARTTRAVSTLQAVPTPSHMALLELQNRGIMKYLVSQNCDGLHRRSGIRPVSMLMIKNYTMYSRSCHLPGYDLRASWEQQS